MPFRKVLSERLSQSVSRQIELLILRGILRPGERLPAERELAERMGVSRPSLREAIAEMAERGLLQSRAGSGVYVDEALVAHFPEPLIRLFATHDEAVNDYIDFRRDIEALAAERAARLGSATDLMVLGRVFERMEAAHQRRSPADEARLDAEFHLAIIEASHNMVMLHMMRSMSGLLREGVFFNRQVMFRQRTTREALLGQHRAIHEAIQAREPEAARSAVEAHMRFIEKALHDQRQAERHEEVARMRLSHGEAR
jgi:GntR family transcriptional repressor for pyruvate dehydrogenase complex